MRIMGRFVAVTLLFFISISIFGCATTIKDYKPRSSEEEAIKMVFIEFESAWNKRGVQRIMAILDDDGRFLSGKERKINSKKEYGDILPTRMAEFPTMAIGIPKINILGNRVSELVKLCP